MGRSGQRFKPPERCPSSGRNPLPFRLTPGPLRVCTEPDLRPHSGGYACRQGNPGEVGWCASPARSAIHGGHAAPARLQRTSAEAAARYERGRGTGGRRDPRGQPRPDRGLRQLWLDRPTPFEVSRRGYHRARHRFGSGRAAQEAELRVCCGNATRHDLLENRGSGRCRNPFGTTKNRYTSFQRSERRTSAPGGGPPRSRGSRLNQVLRGAPCASSISGG